MTNEEKQLLLADLCARLPYGVKVHITNEWFYDKIEPYDRRLDCDVIRNIRVNEYTAKPYLRPMSSMAEEEKKEYTSYCFEQPFLQKDKTPNLGSVPMCIDWLLANHFDYRGLIPMGLALEAPEGMYKIE